jgi:hypothetical protein
MTPLYVPHDLTFFLGCKEKERNIKNKKLVGEREVRLEVTVKCHLWIYCETFDMRKPIRDLLP